MEGRMHGTLAVALVAMAMTGCGRSPSPKLYTLDSVAVSDAGPLVRYAIVVGPVRVPASVDRPEMVMQVGPNRVTVDEFNRWAAPLGQSIARTVAGDLTTLLGTPEVATAPLANFDAAYRVTIEVQRFDSVPGEQALLDAVWVVRAKGGGTRSGRTVASEPVLDASIDALAAAHSRALATLSGDVAAAIRTVAVDER
jgi:uncharacterized lipoprotein YmbA